MFNSSVDEIKTKLDIVEVVGNYIKLQKTGINYRGLCPFHTEKKPSFFVSPTRQMWHCFGGCSEGGDIFKFVMKIENMEFGEALKILAQKAGVELKPTNRESIKWRTERNRLLEICELAAKFFEKQLSESRIGQEAKNYLLKRGITKESIEEWRIGYSPDTWQALFDFLIGKGYKREEIIKAGLAIEKEDIRENSCGIRGDSRSIYDRFRGRIIFPIFDLNSRIIGFAGRVFKNKDKTEVAKYVNTPNTFLYNKSRVLYGLDKAKLEIRKKDFCILVEGYTDVILSYQAGVKNIIAASGTALTNFQLEILKRYSNNLVLCFDMDIAGENATKRGIDLAQEQGFNIKIIRLPEGKDAAEIIAKNSKEWEESVLNQKSIYEFYFDAAFSEKDSTTVEGKKEISKILLPIIKKISNKIEQSFWIQKLSCSLDIKEQDVLEELKKIKTDFSPSRTEILKTEENKSDIVQKSRKDLLEERLFILILKLPENFHLISEKEFNFSFHGDKIFQLFKKDGIKTKDFPKDFPSETIDFLNYLVLKAEFEKEEEEKNSKSANKNIQEEFSNILREMKKLNAKNRLDEISKEIKMAEQEKDLKKIEKLTCYFNQLTKEIDF